MKIQDSEVKLNARRTNNSVEHRILVWPFLSVLSLNGFMYVYIAAICFICLTSWGHLIYV